MRAASLGFVGVSALTLSGCGATYYHQIDRELPGSRVTYSDVKQRAVFAQTKTSERYPWYRAPDGRWYQSDRPVQQQDVVNCPEPPPDALTALARSGSGNLSLAQKLALGASFSESESAAAIGLRTQSTELLKQQSTNHCLAYQFAGLSRADFQMLTFDQQPATMGIEAIEQLTGAAKAQGGTVTATATASGGSPSDSGTADKPAADADPAATAATGKKATKPGTPAKKKTTPAAGTPDTPAPSVSVTTQPASGASSMKDVADAVRDIVSETLDVGFTRDVCATLILGVASGDMPEQVPGAKECLDYLHASTRRVQNINQMLSNVDDYMLAQIVAHKPISDDALRYLTMMAVAGSGGKLDDPKPVGDTPAVASVATAGSQSGHTGGNKKQTASGHVPGGTLAGGPLRHTPVPPLGGVMGGGKPLSEDVFVCGDHTLQHAPPPGSAACSGHGGPMKFPLPAPPR